MRIYEELFIVRPDATDLEIDPYVEQISNVITGAGGKIETVDKWGVRKLAYRVQKRQEGYYILIRFASNPETVREVERRLRVADMVMKFITVRIDENLKRIEKRRKEREKRAARKPPAPVLQPALPSAAAPVAPAMPGLPPEAPAAPAPAAPAPAAPSAPAPAPAAAEGNKE